jgi:hypothetical protein
MTENRRRFVMKVKLIAAAAALALLGSTNVFAGQQFGRDSVYATPGAPTYSSKSSAVAGVIRPGRSSVYVGDVPAPRPPSKMVTSIVPKPGRA